MIPKSYLQERPRKGRTSYELVSRMNVVDTRLPVPVSIRLLAVYDERYRYEGSALQWAGFVDFNALLLMLTLSLIST